MIIDFFNTLWIFFFKHSLFGIRLDTSKLPFSFIARFGLFYKADFWFCNNIIENKDRYCLERHIDLIIPYVCDINFVKEVE